MATTTPDTQQPSTPADDQPTVALVSLGCPKNLVDSEKMLGLAAEAGYVPVPSDAPADALIINTCGFLEASKEESLGEITAAARRKHQGEVGRIVVAGCLVQRHRAKLLDWCPDIDALIGVFDRDRVAAALRPQAGHAARDITQAADDERREESGGSASGGIALPVYSSIASSSLLARRERQLPDDASAGYFESDAGRLRLTPRHWAYLRVSEGCNQNCAFCTIPSIRGKMRSKYVDAILAEARELLADGVFEINLIGQDTTSFGQDIGYEPGLVGLLEALDREAQHHGGAWIRLMYAYPSCFTDDMIDAIASLPNIVKYIDMPLQHINDRVLDLMRRRTSRSLIETLLGKLRDRMDRAGKRMAIRTTFITGYPTETEDEHRELVRFVEQFGFDAMGVFTYSPEPNTPAGSHHTAALAKGNAVDHETAERRKQELMLAQQQVVFARNDEFVAQQAQMDVLIDGPAELEDDADMSLGNVYLARHADQAPQVDATTIVLSRETRSPGELVPCTVIDSDDYDLVARPTDELTPTRSLNVLR